jgi:hypothetical protein
MRATIAQIDKPPDTHPSRTTPKHSPDQMKFCYA